MRDRGQDEFLAFGWNFYLETGLDSLDTAGGVTGHALQEEQPRLLVQDRVRRSGRDCFKWNFNIYVIKGTCRCDRLRTP